MAHADHEDPLAREPVAFGAENVREGPGRPGGRVILTGGGEAVGAQGLRRPQVPEASMTASTTRSSHSPAADRVRTR
nr:hypothetical protein GCM10025732_07870 [Glycomyces mayteni]